MRKRIIYILIFASTLIGGCQKDKLQLKEMNLAFPAAPKGFPPVQFPADNEYTDLRWKLGKMLFYDTRLSADSTISCGSCHNPAFSFSNNLPMAIGAFKRIGVRNVPTLVNVAYQPYFTSEGGVPTLEMQVLVPFQEHHEFDLNILLASQRLMGDSIIVDLSKKAYNRLPDYYTITRALANFERSILSGNSKYDAYQNGNTTALNESEKAGMRLFFSDKTNCSACHNGLNFTNYSFQNNGLYNTYNDIGRKRLTGKNGDNALFKVPTLRNVSLTAPYMHDGSFATLDEVIEHYNKGGQYHENKSDLIKTLNLSKLEKKQLIDFMNALTDTKLINNKKFYK